MAKDTALKSQGINFKGLNAEFAVLQNIELGVRNFDGEFANLEAPAIGQAKGALKLLAEDLGYSSIRKGLRFRKGSRDVIIAALTKNTKLTEGTATAGSNTTLVHTGAGWTIDAYVNKYLKYTVDDEEKYCLIESNTADTLTITYQTEALSTPTYEIWEPDALYEYSIANNTLTLLKDNLAPYRKWTGVAANSYVGTPEETGGDTVLLAETTATGGTTTTLIKTGETWTVDTYKDKVVKYEVNNLEYYIKIKSNTADTLTFDRTSEAPASGVKFTIYTPIQPFISSTWTSIGVYNSASGISALTDTTLLAPDNELNSRYVYPNVTDVNNAGDLYSISRNEGTKLYVDGNCTVASGKAYKIIHASYSDKFQDSTKTWQSANAGEHAGRYIHITAGKGRGQLRQIVKNDVDTLYLKLSWNETPDETSQYAIYKETSQVLFMGNGVDWLQRYDGTTVTELTNRPKGEFLYLRQGRVFLTGDVELPYKGICSEIDDPEYFPITNVFVPEGFDKCTGFGEFGNELFMFKRRSLHQLVEGTVNNYAVFVPRKKPNANGCISQHTVASVQLKGGSQLWYHDGKQVNSLGYSANYVGAILTSSSSPLIDSSVAKGNTAKYEKEMESVFDGRYYWLSFPMESDYNDFCYRYDTKYNFWLSRTGLNISTFIDVEDDLYGCTSDETAIYKLEQDRLNDGDGTTETPIDQRIVLKGTYTNDPFDYKSLMKTRFLFDREAVETSAYLGIVCSKAYDDPVRFTKNISIAREEAPILLDETGEVLDEFTELDRTDTVDTPVIYIHEVSLTNFYMYKFELRNNLADNYFRLIGADMLFIPERISAPSTIH